jgi:predicted kinase
MHMRNLYLTRGIPASGKTTWAQEFVEESQGTIKRVAKDDLRTMLDGSHKYGNEHARFLTNLRNHATLNVLTSGFDAVVDETFVLQRDIDSVVDLYGTIAEITVVLVPCNLEECIERDRHRERSVGADLIRDYHRILEEQCTSTPLLLQKHIRYIMGTYTLSSRLEDNQSGLAFL